MGPDPVAALIALNRFGFGARPGDLAAAAADPRGFLKSELSVPSIALIEGAELPGTKAALQALFADQEMKRMQREMSAASAPAQPASAASAPPMPSMAPPTLSASAETATRMTAPPEASASAQSSSAGQPARGAAQSAAVPAMEEKSKPAEPTLEQKMFRAEALARFHKQVKAGAGFVERLVAFWSNHFCVSRSKSQLVNVAAGPFEREAIRPHILGRFSDMLRAVEQHPAMLAYLDNQQSIGPNSQAGRNRNKGLNENLAREILELHTLGVGSGYSQADVTSLARIITGWTFAGREGRLGEPGTFTFVANWHEPGSHILLNKIYAEDGVRQGEAALADIARHASTATHIARKLARHFVADEPPEPLVAKLSKIFSDCDGDLRIVSAALVDESACWEPAMTKIRTPYEFLIAAARALGHAPDDPGPFIGALNAMGMGLWQPPGPNGFPDTASAWASPEGLKVRLDISAQIAQRVKDLGDPLSVLDTVAGVAASAETRQAVSRAESRPQALAIVFMSPEFQRR
jgi:uncharacterized protein (DUF1800 family)